jgi:hypothetical protein
MDPMFLAAPKIVAEKLRQLAYGQRPDSDSPTTVRERRLNPFLWATLAIITAGVITVAVGIRRAAESPSRLFLALLFVSSVAIAMIIYMGVEQHFRRQSLSKAASEEGDRLRKLIKGLEDSRRRSHENTSSHTF